MKLNLSLRNWTLGTDCRTSFCKLAIANCSRNRLKIHFAVRYKDIFSYFKSIKESWEKKKALGRSQSGKIVQYGTLESNHSADSADWNALNYRRKKEIVPSNISLHLIVDVLTRLCDRRSGKVIAASSTNPAGPCTIPNKFPSAASRRVAWFISGWQRKVGFLFSCSLAGEKRAAASRTAHESASAKNVRRDP